MTERILTADGLDDLLAEFDGGENESIANTYPDIHDGGDVRGNSGDVSSNADNVHQYGLEQRDASGTLFDSDLHCLTASGEPRLTKNGNFRLKRGAKANPNHMRGINIPGKGELSLDEPSPLAKTAALGYIQTGVMLFGQEWLPDATKKEQEFLTQAFHEFFIEFFCCVISELMKPEVHRRCFYQNRSPWRHFQSQIMC